MNRAFGGIEGGGIVAARIFCNEAFLRVIHPSIHPLIPTQFVPFYFYPLQVDALEERRRDVPLLVFVKGSAAFPTPPKARKDAAGATTVVMPCSYATVDCLPTARPTNPNPIGERDEGRDGVVIGTTELWKAAGWRWVRATTTYGWLWSVRPLSFPLSLTHFN